MTAATYARALYVLAIEDNSAEIISEELEILRKCIEAQPEYMNILDAAHISIIQKIRLIDTAFRNAHPYIRNLIKLLAENRRAYLYPESAAEYRKIYEKERDIVRARIILPYAADEKTLKNIQRGLSAKTGKKVVLQMETEPGLTGGMVLEMDGRRFDNSIRSRLRNIRNGMHGNFAEE